MALPTYGEDYTPAQDAFQSNDIPMNTSLPFENDEEEPICPGEPMPDMDQDSTMIPPIPWPGRNRRTLCLAQGRRGPRGGSNLFYAFGNDRRQASRRALRKCRRQTFFRCQLYWCGRVNN